MRISELGDPKAEFSPSSLQKKLVSGMLKSTPTWKKGTLPSEPPARPSFHEGCLRHSGTVGPCHYLELLLGLPPKTQAGDRAFRTPHAGAIRPMGQRSLFSKERCLGVVSACQLAGLPAAFSWDWQSCVALVRQVLGSGPVWGFEDEWGVA